MVSNGLSVGGLKGTVQYWLLPDCQINKLLSKNLTWCDIKYLLKNIFMIYFLKTWGFKCLYVIKYQCCCATHKEIVKIHSYLSVCIFNPPMVWPFKIFQNLLTGKMAINISEPFKTLHNFLLLHSTIPFNTLWKDLKGRKICFSESCFTFQNLS